MHLHNDCRKGGHLSLTDHIKKVRLVSTADDTRCMQDSDYSCAVRCSTKTVLQGAAQKVLMSSVGRYYLSLTVTGRRLMFVLSVLIYKHNAKDQICNSESCRYYAWLLVLCTDTYEQATISAIDVKQFN